MGSRDIVEVQGVGPLIEKLKGMEGAQLKRKARRAVEASVGRAVIAPIKAAAPHGTNSPWTRYPTLKKKGGPMARKVTARFLRLRGNELVAVSVGPRTWYKHFVIQGTKPHIIQARDAAGERASTHIVKVMNRGGALALSFGGIFTPTVSHPGARADPFVTRSTTNKGDLIRDELRRLL